MWRNSAEIVVKGFQLNTSKPKLARLLLGVVCFLTLGVFLLGLYSYLDLQRLKQQRSFPNPEEAFLDIQSDGKVTVESSRRCSLIIARREVLPLDDLWFVTGRYTVDGEERPAGTLFFHIEGGWVRVSEVSPTPILVYVARRLRGKVSELFDL